MLEVMMRALLIGALATVAAQLFERGLRHLGRGTRHAWTFAIFATTLLPLLPRLNVRTPVAAVIPQVSLPAIVVSGGAVESSGPNLLLIIWVTMAIAVALAYGVSYVRLLQAQRKWRRERLADNDVYFSEQFGPAVFGFTTPRIVVPEWVRATSQEEQRLIVLHEREHIRARDQLLLLLSIAATVVMPWNPFVWLQTRKLRFTLEADCDQRVLNAAPERERYATLLVDVGSRQMGLFMTAALAEYRNGLERRIGMIAHTVIRNRWKAAVLTVAGVAVTVVACESRLPQEPQPASSEPIRATELVRKKDISAGPVFTPYTDRPQLENREEVSRALVRSYPPALRDAGIGGTVLLWTLVDENGRVLKTQVEKGSGHEALDAAAQTVAMEMKFTPARNEGSAVGAWIQLPIVFKTQ